MDSKVSLIYQNQDIVVINKFEGISVHNVEDPSNLIQILKIQLKLKSLYPIHRLDKETSGIQIFALNESAAKFFSDEFQKRTIEKKYIGILRGTLPVTDGVWSNPLTDKAEGRKNPQGLSKERVSCETQFKVIEQSKYFSLCEFNLITGRQHQIRKHAALAKHALVGDQRYGDKSYNKKIAH